MGNIVTNLLSGGAGQLLDGVGKVINAIRGKDPVAAAALEQAVANHEAEFRMAELQQQTERMKADVALSGQQNDVNKAEAMSGDKFAARWRPLIGYICGAALATEFIVGPWMTFIAAVFNKNVPFPKLDMGDLMTLLLGMLGLGFARTMEKIKNAA